MPGRRIVLAALAVALVALGGASALAGPGQDALHEVRAGDNLHLIAGYYYGDARQWERIWHANREQVPDANRIERGLWLRIPDAASPVESYADFLTRMGSRKAVPAAPALPEATAPAPAAVRPQAKLTPVRAKSAAPAAATPAAGGTGPR
jgi:hypothetical protein